MIVLAQKNLKNIKKRIGIDSDDKSSAKKTFTKIVGNVNMKNYDKIITMCKKVKINIYNNKKKVKNYEQLIEACNKKKREIIKEHVITIAPYGSKKGFDKLAGTYVIESLCDEMVQKLRVLDTLIEFIQKEWKSGNNILSLMGIKQVEEDTIDVGDIILEEYSDGQ